MQHKKSAMVQNKAIQAIIQTATRAAFWRILLLCLGVMVCLPWQAQATRNTRPIGTDSRIHVVMYSPDEVFKFTGHYTYQSSIIFAPDEEIQTISMGDSTAWMITPAGNRMFLKPVEQDAQTNMTVLTNKRSYLFELHAREAESIDDPQLIWVLRFVYPMDPPPLAKLDAVPDPHEEGMENFNFNYTLRGNPEVSPIKIYDDGEFTYFEFRDKNAELPAFYMVDEWGKEYILNYRMRGNFVVVERVTSRYTLRRGQQLVCVYNEARPFPHERHAQ
jgi:type IV secretion system protein VirB9